VQFINVVNGMRRGLKTAPHTPRWTCVCIAVIVTVKLVCFVVQYNALLF